MAVTEYVAKKFDLAGLNGISDKALQVHFGLYAGYVTNTNALLKKIDALKENGVVPAEKAVEFAELKRRFGFEYNGMVLHEYYFGNLKAGGSAEPTAGAFYDAVVKSFGSFANWKNDLATVAKMRGVGWAVAALDPSTGAVSNHWITLHEEGNVAGYKPLLVLDVWEHAFLLDYVPADRPKYIEAFFANVDWTVVEGRAK